MSQNSIKSFQKLVLIWSKENFIHYPWRENRKPYRVLISEILLIRTKASQVVPVYNRFIEQYPTLHKFFKVEIENVNDLISSLGLLFRAKLIIELKEQLQNKFNNKIPNNFKDLKSLKGIGVYGANAILCFGFGEKRPLLDSNFIRIYKRVFNVHSKTKTPKTDKFLWGFSEKLLPDYDYIGFNYAVLDLGGTVCLSRKPKCEICPVNNLCEYFENNKKS